VKNRSNIALYILAAVIVLVTARYVQVRVGNFISARRVQEVAQVGPLHRLNLVTSDVYYVGTDFIATVQLNDMYGRPLRAELQVTLNQEMTLNQEVTSVDALTSITRHLYTDYHGRGIIDFSLRGVNTGLHTLAIAVESELGVEHLSKTIQVVEDTGQNFIIHFDKGLYNPSDDVLFRVMALAGATARPLSGERFTISIFDGNDNRVFYENVQASDFGIISGRFSLGDEVNSGFYRLAVAQGEIVAAQAIFEVSPFVLPRFEVILDTDKSAYLVGETIYLTGTAMYFFGEPVNQGVANLYVNSNRVTSEELGEHGEFSLSYITRQTGLYEIWVEVIDNSNYRIEASVTVSAAEGAFVIDVMPEHGYLVRGMPNTVYIFTHTPDGVPVRTFLQISGRGFSRQVATDDNGIGVLILQDVIEQNDISIHAVDMEDNRVQQDFSFAGIERDVTISTNRPRYVMGETIYLELNRRGEGGMFKIYAYRNDRLLQIIKTEHDRAQLNLDDVFGLIDIYAVWFNPADFSHTTSRPHARRTIFIDPSRYMQLTVQSDRPEYKPGEFVNLNFGVTDNIGNPLEAALLVSIVDEAMLSLAANDLSIDNVRLALEDIRFGEDLDAATLYVSLIAGASEQAITRLLLRQNNNAPFVGTTIVVNPHPHYDRGGFNFVALYQAFLNALRLFVILCCSVAFFIVALARRNPMPPAPSPLETQGYLPNAPAVESSYFSTGKRRAAWIVVITLVLLILSFFFFTSCGSSGNERFADDSSMPLPQQDMATDFFSAPAPAPQPLPPAQGQVTQPPTILDEAPTIGTMPELPAAAPTAEIETQTARVRRLFLETMLFVPELIADNGYADLSFILADNITTWNIQVVGNTRDGIVGHTQSSIRAFQPFFVDFELPRNSIRYDRVSIPVTVFNYTEEEQTVILTIAELDWFDLHVSPVQTLVVPSNRSQMVYIPITITQFGDFVFRAYADTHGFADAAERSIRVNPEGFRIRQVVSSGNIENDTNLHLLFMQETIPDTRSAVITFYPSVMSQVIEGMENIFRMPFGCFEQTSSILYPNILALRYMQQNGIDNPQLTDTALRYISSGYQRLLTFEVLGERGGFSLFGHAPAETLLTAYGLMLLEDLTTVYTIDKRVMERMSEFLFANQNNDGSFQITGRDPHRISDSQRLAFNAYIIWALSEAFPEDYRLDVSVEYLLRHLNMVDDNYTLALIANVLVNRNHPRANEVVNQLASNVFILGDTAYVNSSTRDYFGAFGRIQYLQATALTSLALSNHGSHADTNELLINYIISQRDSWGTWHSTQATILSLKALTSYAAQAPLQDGQITITIGNEQRVIEIRSGNTLDFYQVAFTNLQRENIIDIQFPYLGRMTYKVVQEFFAPYDSVELDRGFELSSSMNTQLDVHELVHQEIRIINTSGDIVKNGLVAVSIPQGFRVERSSLALLRHTGLIERYETRFDNINLYLRDTEQGEIITLTIAYRPAFPVAVTGGHVRVFDYYNPMVEGFLKPVQITVQ